MSRILLADDSPHAQRMGERILREEGYEVVTVSAGDTALARLADVNPDLILADVYLPGKSGYEVCEQVRANPRQRHTRVVLTAGLLEHIDDDWVARSGADLLLKKPFEASALLAAIRPLIAAAEAVRAAQADTAQPEANAEPEKPAEQAAPTDAAPVAAEPAAPAEAKPEEAAAAQPVLAKSESEDAVAGTAAPDAVVPQAVPATAEAAVESTSAPMPEPDAERIRAAVAVALDRAMPALIDELTERVLIALGH